MTRRRSRRAFIPSSPASGGEIMTRLLVAAGILAALVLAVYAGQVDRSAPSPSQVALQLSNRLMSPFCPGRTLATCSSPAAAELRAEMLDRLRKRESPEVIVADLTDRFGDAIRGTPETAGVGLMAWGLPVVCGAALFAAIAVAAAGRSGRAEPLPDGDVQPAIVGLDSSDAARRLDDELAALE